MVKIELGKAGSGNERSFSDSFHGSPANGNLWIALFLDKRKSPTNSNKKLPFVGLVNIVIVIWS
jgi:hypothetical protein